VWDCPRDSRYGMCGCRQRRHGLQSTICCSDDTQGVEIVNASLRRTREDVAMAAMKGVYHEKLDWCWCVSVIE